MINTLKKITFILEKKDKTRLIFIFIMMLISAGFDLLGVSAILPIITLLTANIPGQVITIDNFNQFGIVIEWGFRFFRMFGRDSVAVDTMAIFNLCLLGLFYIVKTAYAFLTTYVITKFTMSFSRRLTKRQMETYLSMPYEYHLNNNSSTLIRKCTYDVGNFSNAVNALLNFCIKAITMLAIVVYLFITDFRITLIIGGLLGIFSIFIIIILKPHLRAVAKHSQELNDNNYKYLSQAFNGVKESKISNTESFFIDSYNGNIAGINKYSLRTTMYNSIPGHCLELVGMIGLVISLLIVIIFKNQLGDTNATIIEKFTVFAYAIIKLLPCVTMVNSVINNMNWYMCSIDSIYNDIEEAKSLAEIKEEQVKEYKEMPFENEIKINNISFAYSSALNKKILNNVSCLIKRNTSVAFSGASGAGKTTMIDIILGLLKPQEGNITCDGVDISSNLKGWRENISYIPQTIYLMDDTIKNNIAFGIANNKINDDVIWDSLDKAQLKEFVEQLPNGLDTVIGERGVRLSGGQRQRIGIARAFYRNTNIIVFDEATSALDYETEKNILDHVNKVASDHTLIIITHRLNTIKNCDHIYIIEKTFMRMIK